MGAILTQDGHPVAFFSKKFCPKLQRLSTYVREPSHYISWQKWRHYLLEKQFTIEITRKSLLGLMNQVVQTLDQHNYLSKL